VGDPVAALGMDGLGGEDERESRVEFMVSPLLC
jgi:hypothetical protein